MKRLLVTMLALAAACATTSGAPQPKMQTVCMPCGNPCDFPCPPGGKAKPPPPAPAAAPTFDPAPGSFPEAQKVTIASSTPEAVIHYTTDGSDPTESSPVYSEPVEVSADTTIKALAVAPGLPASEVASAAYSIAPPPAPEPEPEPQPEPAVEAPPPPPPPSHVTVQKEKLELDGKVFFDTGKSTIKPESTSLLDEVATSLQEHPEAAHVVIEGYTDTSGSAKTNKKLSQGRAEAVRAYLVDKGIPAERLTARGMGGTKPLASNKTAKGREQNRRVEFTIHQ